MILDEATKEAFGYLPSEWKPQSHKPIIAVCDKCGKIRTVRKSAYHPLCRPCANNDRIHTEETKAKISVAMKGKCGENANAYKDGKNGANARKNAKHRGLGHTILMPLAEGEVGHHVTNEHVIGISKDIHERLSGYSQEKHRALVLQWLKENDTKKYKIVLSILEKQF